MESDEEAAFPAMDPALIDSDTEVQDEREHNRLLDAIRSLDGKKGRVSQRSEPAASVSEFNISSNAEGRVHVRQLLGALKKSTAHGELKKQLHRVQKRNSTVAVPLSKSEQERIQRTIAYEKTKKEVSKWWPVVEQNRKAEQLEFPLNRPSVKLITSKQFTNRFKPYTSLEKEVAKLLNENHESNLSERKELTKAEEAALAAMSLEEAQARRAELQKHRVLLSYKEAKARRLKKIKSKKYHRIMRKERTKKEQKALEELEKTDPEAYQEKVALMEKNRIQERMSLKHRGGSKFMQQKMIYAKYDNKARQDVQEMLQHSREITRKAEPEEEEEEAVTVATEVLDEAEDASGDGHVETGSSNPWMTVSHGKPTTKQQLEAPVQMEPLTNDTGNSDDEVSAERHTSSMSSLQSVTRTDAMHSSIETDHVDSDSKKIKDLGKVNKECEVVSDNMTDTIDKIFEAGLKKKAQKKKKLKGEMRKKQEEKKKKRQEQKKQKLAKKREEEANKKEQDKSSKKEGKTKKKKKKKKRYGESSSEELSDSDWETDTEVQELGKTDGEGISQSLSRKRTLEDMDTANWSDEETEPVAAKVSKESKKPTASKQIGKGHSTEEVRVDPNKFFTVEGATSIGRASGGELLTEGDTGIDEQQQRMTIMEAFASDDVIEEFSKEKKDVVERDRPKDIDLTLPGWGDWAGAGIQPSKKKKNKFLIKAPPAPPRRDKGLKNVIISETKDNTIAKHQVKQLPFPFTNVHEFEKSIRQPLGKTWNPETAFKALVKPKVRTKLGTVIEPIDKEATFKKGPKRKPMDLPNTESKNRKKSSDVQKGSVKSKI